MSVSELDRLEAESIHVMREVAAELERPVLLFSGGKDSLVLLRLAEKAFRPGALPFPILHVDTGHNFPEVIEFRDRLIEAIELGDAHARYRSTQRAERSSPCRRSGGSGTSAGPTPRWSRTSEVTPLVSAASSS